MAKARWLIVNLADSATISASPALLSTAGETFLQRQGRETARSTSTASQQIKLTWNGTTVSATMVGEAFTNFTTGATRRVQCHANADFTGSTVYDSTALACWNYSGLPSWYDPTAVENRIRKNGAIYFPSVSFKSMTITYLDAPPEGYLDIARMFVGSYFEFSEQFGNASGAQTPGTLTNKARVLSGSSSANKGANFFNMPFNHGFMNDTDMASVMPAADLLGTDRDCWFSLYAGDGNFKEMFHQGAFTMREPTAAEVFEYRLSRGSFMFEGQ